MKEYEYIVEALEGYLCDELTSVICSENYRNKSYGHGYREIFDEYRTLHKEFQAGREKFTDGLHEQEIKKKLQRQCAERRKNAQDKFLRDIRECTKVNIDKYVGLYLKKLEEEEQKTIAKRICMYPYLVYVLRESREGEQSNGEKI